jgi:hypothetical protein
MPARPTLNMAEVDALFAGNYEAIVVTKCDNCALPVRSDDALTFGDPDAIIRSCHTVRGLPPELGSDYEWAFEMPVEPGGPLETELRILRQRHKRQLITLCYPCTDVLQQPPFGWRKPVGNTTLRVVIPQSDEMPRLFAVE